MGRGRRGESRREWKGGEELHRESRAANGNGRVGRRRRGDGRLLKPIPAADGGEDRRGN